jgi:hypothetical protein
LADYIGETAQAFLCCLRDAVPYARLDTLHIQKSVFY